MTYVTYLRFALICFAALLAAPNAAAAQIDDTVRWGLLGTSEQDTLEVDRRSAGQPFRGVYRSWVRQSYTQDQQTPTGNVYRRSLTTYDVDCDRRLIRVGDAILYSQDGTAVSSVELPVEGSYWNDVIPESFGEFLHTKLCQVLPALAPTVLP
jgi:hypothetical protein